ncbi:hypothetical protein PEDI_55630 [Persicobacter diffluens]|uniref:Uncharacterized protein n=1 Tax=Persicobacter diffluens TaxID=981 RepID=A0AAN4W5F9_9BACT|nr:hypothetical protein PEDI_55630 [Persicobacter diffluens]
MLTTYMHPTRKRSRENKKNTPTFTEGAPENRFLDKICVTTK